MLNEGNQIHNFISSSGSGSDFLTSYGSGSTSQNDTVPTVPVPVPVPQRCAAPCEPRRTLSEPRRLSEPRGILPNVEYLSGIVVIYILLPFRGPPSFLYHISVSSQNK